MRPKGDLAWFILDVVGQLDLKEWFWRRALVEHHAIGHLVTGKPVFDMLTSITISRPPRYTVMSRLVIWMSSTLRVALVT